MVTTTRPDRFYMVNILTIPLAYKASFCHFAASLITQCPLFDVFRGGVIPTVHLTDLGRSPM